MTWSTRELAALTGTTVKTIRYYHQVGLLDEPPRAGNGYKLYGVPELLRVLRIRRLNDLGLPLDTIAGMDRDDEPSAEAIDALDAELAQTIERLQRVRRELTLVVRHRTPLGLPAGFETVGDRLSAADRAFATVVARALDDDTVRTLGSLAANRGEVDDTFDGLAADADDAAVEALAVRLAEQIRADRSSVPAIADIHTAVTRRGPTVLAAIAETLAAVYNPAQIRAVVRVAELTDQEVEDDG